MIFQPKEVLTTLLIAQQMLQSDILDTGNYTFLYGVGLDHNYENDLPRGRASRFLSAAIKSDLTTHYVRWVKNFS